MERFGPFGPFANYLFDPHLSSAFFKFLTWPLTEVYHKVNYLLVGVRICFTQIAELDFGNMANFQVKWPKMAKKWLKFFRGLTYDK